MRRAVGLLLVVACSLVVFGVACEDKEPARTAVGDEQRQVGALPYSDKGTRDVRGETIQRIDAENFSFAPTFLRGRPGQTLKLAVENRTTDTPHTFTLTDQGIDREIPPNQAVEVDVTFPQSGGVVFFCKFHTTQGMNGQLLAGDATPQPRR